MCWLFENKRELEALIKSDVPLNNTSILFSKEGEQVFLFCINSKTHQKSSVILTSVPLIVT